MCNLLFTGKTKIFFLIGVAVLAVACSQRNLSKPEVAKVLNKAADWQINNFQYSTSGSGAYLHDYGIDAWTNAVFYIGLFDWANSTANQQYFEWLNQIGLKNEWNVPANFNTYKSIGLYHADEMAIGNFYLKMHYRFKEPLMIEAIQKRADYILDKAPRESMKSNNKQRWTWCDALFMAPTVYAMLYNETGNRRYVDFLNDEFLATYNHLYDKEFSLFFRDDSYFDKLEKNGQKVFWGRGNGWVVAGIANLMKNLHPDWGQRVFYENLSKEMLYSLLRYQDKNGFWHASLLDMAGYPAPETSATALITYAMAYGVNNKYLDKKIFEPAVMKSWKALTSVINRDGRLRYVQPIGADPRKVTADMTAVYGVGALLMAGSEVYKMAK